MPNHNRAKIIHRRTPESAAMLANVKRAMAITTKLNRLTFSHPDEIRALFSELIGKEVDESFILIPPFYAAGGDEIRVGRNVFVNQNCTFYDLGGLDNGGRREDRPPRHGVLSRVLGLSFIDIGVARTSRISIFADFLSDEWKVSHLRGANQDAKTVFESCENGSASAFLPPYSV